MKEQIEEILSKSKNRLDLWKEFINTFQCSKIAELGVHRGVFAEVILGECASINDYLMIDPWRNLVNWNKPANTDNLTFDKYYKETLERTDFAKNKRVILRGKTTEIIDRIDNDSLDFIYVDGDHTLRGISIDLINIWSKINSNGFIAGDDFSPNIWQHNRRFEPTLVFPFAVYFAEAMKTKIYGLPYNQFLITKETNGFEFIDLTNFVYKSTEILYQFSCPNRINTLKSLLINNFPALYRYYKKK